MKKIRRRIYLIDRPFQLKFIGVFVALAVLVALAVGAVTHAVLGSVVERHLYSPHISQGGSGEILRPAILWINAGFSLALVASAVGLVFWHLRRAVGSLRRFSDHVAGMGAGVLPGPIHFRRKDPLHAVANDFNAMVGGLRGGVEGAARRLEEARDRLDALEREQEGVSPGPQLLEVRRLLSEASERLEFEGENEMP
jgi:hypothetical protein